MAGRKNSQPETIGLGESLNQAIDDRIRSGLSRLFEEISSVLKDAAGVAPTAGRGRGRPRKAGGGTGQKCKESGCTNEARSKGLCSKHYQKARRAALTKEVKPPAPKVVKKHPAKKKVKKDAAAPAAAAA